MDDLNKRGIYTDLVRVFEKKNHNITVVYPTEKRENKKTSFKSIGNISLIAVKTGNITKCKNVFEKGIATLRLENQFIYAINKHCQKTSYDLVLYSTPPITFSKVVKKIKKNDGAKSYLMLKDIFPQNALDIGLLRSRGIWYFITKWFRHKEQDLYRISDFIGCMSPQNAAYLLKHNPTIQADKVEVCPNSIEPVPRKESSIPKNTNCRTFLYGGNLGKPQGISFLLNCLHDNMNKSDRKFIICGTGTEAHQLEDFISKFHPNNITYISGLGVDEYEQLVYECDVGMIFLDNRFTIPNFPSRILSYMEKSLPVLACTDANTDIGTIINDGNFGWWCESKRVEEFTQLVDSICNMSSDLLKQYGENSRDYLESNYTADITYNIIMKHFDKGCS